ncbi:PREDICTED: tRNA pseudouridine synthase-like 1 isoform X2 [Corvus brachyrhynchos]|uniref:tRNA pseudouridine synthase-like 1 isoform X2 n=1 Tax=Corvus brachyrhynchos TaxID=85066 RepID=UPI000816420F|nr:PREDICTED: tRNA pseudouridine synthase-like 1 isoform X2 [Corvus brachyrhynchos]
MVGAPARYLVFFQYFGTRYSGVMETKSDQALVGVQNYLEKAAQNLRPSVPIKFHISSRTDSGVHALANAAHLDIQRAPGKAAFSGKQLVQGLNYHLKPEPICPLDISALGEAANFLLGTHDFSTFRSLSSETPFQCPVRTLLQLEIQPAPGFLSHHNRGLEFWEVKFKSRSFLYRQVRRMVGALVAVGQGKLSPQDIQELLEVKDARAFPPHAMAPPSGLFLKSVEYSQADLAAPSAPAEEELCGLS